MMKKLAPLSFLLAALLLAACSAAPASSAAAASSAAPAASPASPAASGAEAQLTLAAAASLEDVFTNELIPLFETQNPGITITGTYASSGNLQTQIEEGMAADIFISAAQKQMNALTEQGLMNQDSVVPLLENEIVLIVPADSALGITSFEDLPTAATIALGDPESVPVGQYSKEALENLGLWETVQPKLTLGTDVTQVLNWVAEGSAEAGIVYATDAAQMPDKVKVAAKAPEGSLKTPVIYPVATSVSPDAPKYQAAQLFLNFLQSEEALALFLAKGFTPAV